MSSLPLFHPVKSIEATFHQEAEIVAFNGDVADFVKKILDESITLILLPYLTTLAKSTKTA
jgi:adenine-specific DNA-methyltransferase